MYAADPRSTVPERSVPAPPRHLPPDPATGVGAGLHRHLGEARQGAEAHHVADDEDLRVTGDGEVRTDLDPTGPVAGGAGGQRQLARPGPAPPRRRSTAPSRRRSASRARPRRSPTAPPRPPRSPATSCAAGRRAPPASAPPWPTVRGRTRPGAPPRRRRAARGRPRARCCGTPLPRLRVASSRICPASSTPVGPPPAMAKVSHASLGVVGGASRPSRRRRTPCGGRSSASSSVFIPGAHCANSSWPK